MSLAVEIGIGILGDVIYDESIDTIKDIQQKYKKVSKIPWYLGFGGEFSGWFIVGSKDLPSEYIDILKQEIEIAKLNIKECNNLYNYYDNLIKLFNNKKINKDEIEDHLKFISNYEKLLVGNLINILKFYNIDFESYKNGLMIYNENNKMSLRDIIIFSWKERLNSLNGQLNNRLTKIQNLHNDLINCEKTCNCRGYLKDGKIICSNLDNKTNIDMVGDFRPSLNDDRLIIPLKSQGLYKI